MMRNQLLRLMLLLFFVMASQASFASANIEIDTPGINQIEKSMQQRYSRLVPFYTSGAVGFTQNGLIAIHDANVVPLAERQIVNSLVAAENQDRNALYLEIARANNNLAWEKEIRRTFGQRWIKLAKSGWWYQTTNGGWVQK